MADTPVTIHCTKPRSQLARALRASGADVLALEPPTDVRPGERYALSQEVALDRYTGASFARAIAEKILFIHALDLRESFAAPVVLLEGELTTPYSGFHPQALRGALSALIVEYGVSVLRTADLEESLSLVLMMAVHAQHGVPEISLHAKRRATDVFDQQRRVVEMLPGAGLVGARRLLQRFGSLGRLLAATEEEIRRVPGFGPQKAAQIGSVLATEYRAVDTEHDVEEAIARRPELLLGSPAELLARQHVLFDDEGAKHVIDLVLGAAEEPVAYVAELKRASITNEHVEQLTRYLDRARHSELLASLIDAGFELRGVLASPEPSSIRPKDRRVTVIRLDREALIEELLRARREWLEELDAAAREDR
jgi:ERCC4-type nuclease